MKCSKCGYKGKGKEQYCPECGSKLDKIPFPKISKKIQIILISILVTFILLIIGFQVGNYLTSPATIAKKYFEKVMNNDIKGIYHTIDVETSTFVSEALLKEKMTIFPKVDDYQIIDVKIVGRESYVTFEYYLEKDNKPYYATVKLYRSKENCGLFFPKWQIDSGKLVENIKIEVPKGAKVTIDQKQVTDYLNLELSSDTADIYQIPFMIAGTYTFEITLDHDITAKETIKVEENQTYILGNVIINDALQSELEDKVLQNLKVLFENAIASQPFDAMKEKITNIIDPNTFQTIYISLKRSLENSIISYQKIEISSVNVQNATYNEDGKLEVTFLMTHHDTGMNRYTEKAYQKTDVTTILTVVFDQNSELQISNIKIGNGR